jgi:hypothetical protein
MEEEHAYELDIIIDDNESRIMMDKNGHIQEQLP